MANEAGHVAERYLVRSRRDEDPAEGNVGGKYGYSRTVERRCPARVVAVREHQECSLAGVDADLDVLLAVLANRCGTHLVGTRRARWHVRDQCSAAFDHRAHQGIERVCLHAGDGLGRSRRTQDVADQKGARRGVGVLPDAHLAGVHLLELACIRAAARGAGRPNQARPPSRPLILSAGSGRRPDRHTESGRCCPVPTPGHRCGGHRASAGRGPRAGHCP